MNTECKAVTAAKLQKNSELCYITMHSKCNANRHTFPPLKCNFSISWLPIRCFKVLVKFYKVNTFPAQKRTYFEIFLPFAVWPFHWQRHWGNWTAFSHLQIPLHTEKIFNLQKRISDVFKSAKCVLWYKICCIESTSVLTSDKEIPNTKPKKLQERILINGILQATNKNCFFFIKYSTCTCPLFP